MRRLSAVLVMAFLLVLAVAIVPRHAALAAAFTRLTAVHLINSLIDTTPIGTQTPSTGAFTTLQASGLLPSTQSAQGAYLEWNATQSLGETDFINLRGGGAGGFSWYSGSGYSTVAQLASLTSNGVFIATGGFSGNLSGNATSATNATNASFATSAGTASVANALSGSPTQCGAPSTAKGIAANGNANCIKGSQTGAVTGCTTGPNSYDSCGSFVGWGVAYANTSYIVTCSGINASNPRASIGGLVKATNGVTVTTVTEGSTSVSFGEIDCIAQ